MVMDSSRKVHFDAENEEDNQEEGEEGGKSQSKCYRFNKKYWMCILYPSILLLLIIFIVFSTLTQYGQPKIEDDLQGRKLKNGRFILSKDYWDADLARGVIPRLHHPVPFVVISHTNTGTCSSYNDCVFIVRILQRRQMTTQTAFHYNADIVYNFVVGGDGNVYEGRGWDVANEHAGFLQQCSIEVSVIGNFSTDVPNDETMESLQALVQLGVTLGKIDVDFRIVALNQTMETESPGKNLYHEISKLPQFLNQSDIDTALCLNPTPHSMNNTFSISQ
ncbi:peptidoglycan recognition protein-like isoform X2 [Periplaneta americana]